MPDSHPHQQDLEIKLSFLERTVESLSDTILEQGKSLQRIERRCDKLERALKAVTSGGRDEVGPQDDPPPHY